MLRLQNHVTVMQHEYHHHFMSHATVFMENVFITKGCISVLINLQVKQKALLSTCFTFVSIMLSGFSLLYMKTLTCTVNSAVENTKLVFVDYLWN